MSITAVALLSFFAFDTNINTAPVASLQNSGGVIIFGPKKDKEKPKSPYSIQNSGGVIIFGPGKTKKKV